MNKLYHMYKYFNLSKGKIELNLGPAFSPASGRSARGKKNRESFDSRQSI